jgi:glycosyltransferase involved in cell wall biosynthesis
MSPTKGVHAAIRAARAARIPLRIAAKCREEDEWRYLHDVVEPMLGDGVEFVGEVRGDEKVELLGQAACLLNPIAWPEPFGMVMIEALACGTPVVATRRGSVPEIVDHGTTGFVCRTGEELVGFLARVGELDRSACRAAAVHRFSMARMAADHVALYRRVLGTGRPMLAASTGG